MTEGKMPKLRPAYILVGNDSAMRHLRVQALKKAFSEAYGSMTVETVDANSTPASSLAMSLMSPSLLAGERIVVAKNIEAWASSTANDAAVLAIAENYVPQPVSGTVLLLTGARMPKKTKAWKALAAAVVATSPKAVMDDSLPKDWEMHSWVRTRAAEMGLGIGKSEAEHLISVVGQNPMTLYSELAKLWAFLSAGSRKDISRADIDVLAVPKRHLAEYKMSDAFSAGDLHAAEMALAKISEKTTPTQLVNVLAREARIMVAVSGMVSAGLSDQRIGEGLKSGGFFRAAPSDWVVRQYRGRSAKYDAVRSVRVLQELAEADLSMKGGSRVRLDDRFVLERMIVRSSPGWSVSPEG